MFRMMYELRLKKELTVLCLDELFLWPQFLPDREHTESPVWKSYSNSVAMARIKLTVCVMLLVERRTETQNAS